MTTKYTVTVDGAVVGTRKSDRTYTHALVCRSNQDGRLFVRSFHGSEALAAKAAATLWNKGYSKPDVVPVQVAGVVAHQPAVYQVAYYVRSSKRIVVSRTFVQKKNALRAARYSDGTVIPVVFEANHSPIREA